MADATSTLIRRRHPRNGGPQQRAARGAGMILMVMSAVVTAVPLLILVFNAFKSNSAILQHPAGIPSSLHPDNIADAWRNTASGAPLSHAFFNSLIVTVATVAIVTVLSSLAGYGLGAFRFRGDRFATTIILLLIAIPTQATLIPVFNQLGQWNLRNSYVGIILVYSAFWMPFSVLLLRAAFRSFPKELSEAARVDGCNNLQVLWRVALPILKGPISGVAVINAIGIWSELLFAYVLLNQPSKRTLPTAILAFQGEYTTNYRLLYAALLISVVPVLAFYAVLSSKIRKGVSAGSLK